MLAGYGLDRGSWDILASLRRNGPPFRLSPTALYRDLMRTWGATTYRLHQLERAGLVERVLDPGDRRSTLVALTAAGQALVDAVAPIHMENERHLLTALSGEERETLAGLGDRQTEAAFIWLPIPHADIRYAVLATEQVYVALSSSHPFARRRRLQFAEIADEPIVALPVEAGPQRDFWLGSDARESPSARIAATVDTADETFEVVSSGAGVALLAEGNARIYRRSGIRCVPVQGLPPARLAIAWRQQNRHPAVRAFVQACQEAVGT